MSESSAEAMDPRQLFEQNCSEYRNYLLNFLCRVIGDRAEAEELTQDSFLHLLAFMERKQWQAVIRSPKAYLIATAIHVRRDKKRGKDLWKGRREEGSVDYDDEQAEHIRKVLDREAVKHNDPTDEIEDGIFFKELYKELPVNTLLSGLSRYEAEIFRLKADGFSTKEIGQVVQKPEAQVRYDLQKLNAKFRYRVRKVLGDSGGNPFTPGSH